MGCPWNPVDCVTGVAKSVAGDAFDSIAHYFGQAADSAVNWLWAQIGSATTVHLGGHGFDLDVGIVAAISATVAVGLFVIQLITATLRRDPGGLARAVKGLVVAFVAGGAAIAVVNVLIGVTDRLSAGVVQVATGGSIQQMGHDILAGGSVSAATGNPAAIMLLSLAALVAVVVVWAALMVRKVLIVVTAVFAPLAFAGSLADITVAWTRRWIETTVALIVSKLILVLIFVVGLGMLVDGVGQAGSGATQTVTQIVCGMLVLTLAGFAPWVALKVVHFVGDQAHHLHLLASTSTAGAGRVYSAAQKAQPWVTGALAAPSNASGRGGGNGTGGNGSRPATFATRPSTSPPGPGAPPSANGASPGPSGSAGPSSSTLSPPGRAGPSDLTSSGLPGAVGTVRPTPPARSAPETTAPVGRD
jgi:type IV secretion system protein TrbL